MMKNTYLTPVVLMISISNEDVLTASSDVDYVVNGKTLTNKYLGKSGERGIADELELGI